MPPSNVLNRLPDWLLEQSLDQALRRQEAKCRLAAQASWNAES